MFRVRVRMRGGWEEYSEKNKNIGKEKKVWISWLKPERILLLHVRSQTHVLNFNIDDNKFKPRSRGTSQTTWRAPHRRTLAERIQAFKLSVLFFGAAASFRFRCKSIAILQSDRRCPTCRQAKAPRRSTSATIYSTPVHRRRTDEVQDCSAWQVQVSTDRQKARTDPSASRAKSNTCPQLQH